MRIRWTQPAASDLTSICDYIEEQDGARAARRIARFDL
jgi:plasmid stabilization system protein ParE